MENPCLSCGRGPIEEKRGTFRFEPPPNIPGGVVEIPNAVWRECAACGEQIIGHELDRAIDDQARRRQGLLTPAEIKAVREQTGLSQEAMAQLLGVGDKTYTRWETGKSFQNKSSDNLIRLVDRNAGLFAQLEAQRRPDRQRIIAEYVAGLQTIKGDNKLAMAAHGGDLDPTVGELLRRKLREILEAQQGD
jgi:HTH-type transcriptional regulator/antitoxin MqsA